jgi:hypothetical protein
MSKKGKTHISLPSTIHPKSVDEDGAEADGLANQVNEVEVKRFQRGISYVEWKRIANVQVNPDHLLLSPDLHITGSVELVGERLTGTA